MINIFSLLESFLFLFLGISFILILLMVYHFKKRLDVIEKKNETLGDICKTIVKQIEQLKTENVIPKGESVSKQPNPASLEGFLSTMMHPNMNPEIFMGGNLNSYIHVPSKLNTNIGEIDIVNLENAEMEDVESVETENSSHSDLEEIVEEIMDDEKIIESDNIDTIQVTKLDETEIYTEDDLQSYTDTSIAENYTKSTLQKMNVQMLRTIVIRDGYNTEPSKLKKQELIELILSKEDDST